MNRIKRWAHRNNLGRLIHSERGPNGWRWATISTSVAGPIGAALARWAATRPDRPRVARVRLERGWSSRHGHVWVCTYERPESGVR